MDGTFVHHHLKIAPVFYHDVVSGKKKFEIRVNDRNFLEGDHLILQEFEDGEYTGNELEVMVTYIPDFTLPGNYVVMGIEPAAAEQTAMFQLAEIKNDVDLIIKNGDSDWIEIVEDIQEYLADELCDEVQKNNNIQGAQRSKN